MVATRRPGVRKFLATFFLATLALFYLVPLMTPAALPAASITLQIQSSPADNICGGEGRYFLGIPSWDRGLGNCEDIEAEEILSGDKFKIIANNIMAIATHVAAFVAIGFIIYGGFAFVLSSGNAEQATNARKTIINAAVGAVIVVMARVLTEVIYNNLTG